MNQPAQLPYDVTKAGIANMTAALAIASDEASYVSGARVAVTGGQPIL